MVKKEDFKKYLKERYETQVRWYDKKSVFNKRLNYILSITVIFLAAITPIFAALNFKILTIIFAALVSIGTGIITFCKFDEHWQNYRTTCESLKKEKDYYNHKINDYKNAEDPEKLFINRVSSLISKENTEWSSIAIKQKEKK